MKILTADRISMAVWNSIAVVREVVLT